MQALSFRGAGFSLLAFLVSACAVGPDYEIPEIEVADEWHRELTDGLETGDANLHSWWTLLEDEKLEDLILRAAQGNVDLQIAWSRVMEARGQRTTAAGNRWPDIKGQGSALGREVSENVLPGAGGNNNNIYNLGANAFWEVDVWGRITRLIESADADVQAQVEGYRDVMVMLYAEVALNYVDLRSLQERIRLAENNVKLQTSTLQLVKDRRDAQLVSDLDVAQAELNLKRTSALIPTLRAASKQSMHRLAVLIGEQPGTLNAELDGVSPIPKIPDTAQIILPYEVVRQRPDIRQAERQLASATADIGVATAELYPKFSLIGTVTLDAINGSGSNFFSSDSIGWSFGPQFSWNLFNGGRVQGQIDAAWARADQGLANYRQTILLAFEEVENSIVAFAEERNRQQTLLDSVKAAQRSVELVDSLYRNGLVYFQNVLDMQRSLVAQQDSYAESTGFVVQDLVLLYKALGGGWAPEPAAEAAAAGDAAPAAAGGDPVADPAPDADGEALTDAPADRDADAAAPADVDADTDAAADAKTDAPTDVDADADTKADPDADKDN